jgi:hypothetical protein
LRASAKLSQIPYSFDNALVGANEVFPEGELDADFVDLRKTNAALYGGTNRNHGEMIEVRGNL